MLDEEELPDDELLLLEDAELPDDEELPDELFLFAVEELLLLPEDWPAEELLLED